MGMTIALICLAALVLYTWHVQTAQPRLTICPHCGDAVQLLRYTFMACPSCGKVIAG